MARYVALMCTLLISSAQANYDPHEQFFEWLENDQFDQIEANREWYDPEYV